MTSLRLVSTGLAFVLSAVAAWAEAKIVVQAAAMDRAGVVVNFPWSDQFSAATQLRDAHGNRVEIQRHADGRGQFVLARVAAGEAPEFTIETNPAEGQPESAREIAAVQTVVRDDVLRVSVGGNDFFDYWITERPFPREGMNPLYARSGFIHPVRTPSGAVVTSSYPADHLHHQGIWSPWTKTRFQGRTPDFWNMGQGTGKVEFAALSRHWNGAVHGGFVAQHRFIDLSAPSPVVALNETWEVTVYHVAGAEKPVRVFDLLITQVTATDDALELPEYRYGGLGMRGPEEWLGADRANFLTSEGETDRVKANATRVRWYHMGGLVSGALAGSAVLDHPENFRAPQPLRIHPKEPYACNTPSQLGDWQIEPGKPYVARYRFVIADGAPDAALLEAYWQGYAHPGEAKLVP
jgi:hypothetical protein